MGEETETMAESTAKLRKQILGLTNINGTGGIDILTPDGEGFRNIYDIMSDIAGIWDQLKDIDQAAITELLAG